MIRELVSRVWGPTEIWKKNTKKSYFFDNICTPVNGYLDVAFSVTWLTKYEI